MQVIIPATMDPKMKTPLSHSCLEPDVITGLLCRVLNASIIETKCLALRLLFSCCCEFTINFGTVGDYELIIIFSS